jgi:hypothetical protein
VHYSCGSDTVTKEGQREPAHVSGHGDNIGVGAIPIAPVSKLARPLLWQEPRSPDLAQNVDASPDEPAGHCSLFPALRQHYHFVTMAVKPRCEIL